MKSLQCLSQRFIQTERSKWRPLALLVREWQQAHAAHQDQEESPLSCLAAPTLGNKLAPAESWQIPRELLPLFRVYIKKVLYVEKIDCADTCFLYSLCIVDLHMFGKTFTISSYVAPIWLSSQMAAGVMLRFCLLSSSLSWLNLKTWRDGLIISSGVQFNSY